MGSLSVATTLSAGKRLPKSSWIVDAGISRNG
jgi:hypothetical protein